MINSRFNINKKIGKGRSSVFQCEDIDFPGIPIAIKILDKDAPAEEVKGLKDEYFTLRRLNHPNIIKANEIGTIVEYKGDYTEISAGSKYITLEYFGGTNLLEYEIRDESVLVEIITQLCSVLFYLHQSNYIYYDLKPQNILINDTAGIITLKLIDMGLARLTYEETPDNARGTAEYIAPDLLSRESHDHRVDLYSFGMLLYRLIYKQFPFDTIREIDIYKAHLSAEFNFPTSHYPDIIINVVKKLLEKDQSKRYYTALQVLYDLGIPVEEIKRDWVPARAFTNRKDILAIIDTFFNRHSDGEIFCIRGTEGAGKTSIIEEIYRRYDSTVYIKGPGFNSYTAFWKILLREIVFSDFTYNTLPADVLNDVNALLVQESGDLMESLKSIIVRIVRENKFILLLDEYNRYDEFSFEIIKQLIPVFQVNNIKVVLTEDSSYPYVANEINNLLVANLSPFTESHLIEYLDKSFADFFPKKEVMKLIMMYADIFPGSIDAFLKDLVLLSALEFLPDGPGITDDPEKIKLLTASQDSIYNIHLKVLSPQEYLAAEYLSLFDINIREDVLASLIETDIKTASAVVTALREKNIISQINISVNPEFTSSGLRKYIYSGINQKNNYHRNAAEIIRNSFPSFNKTELARQYELAGLFHDSYEVIKDELDSAERLSAYSYMKKLLLHLLEFPLSANDMLEIKYSLAITAFRLGDKKYSLEIIDELLNGLKDEQKRIELLQLKGNCLISTGILSDGITVLTNVQPLISTEQKQLDVLFDIASAHFDLNDYSKTIELCNKIIQNSSSSNETKGKAYNLLALVGIYNDNNDSAILYLESALEHYKRANLLVKVAGVELNMGNIFCMKTDYNKAEEHWNNALEINSSIGNLDQEAKLLMNYGVYYFYKPDYEAAADNYHKAHNIFSSLGDKISEGMILLNLGETYLHVCNYNDSLQALVSARKIFADLKNYEEEAELLLVLAKYYYILGDDKLLIELTEHFKILSGKAGAGEKFIKGQLLLESLVSYIKNEFTSLSDNFIVLSDYYYEKENSILYAFTTFLTCEIYLKTNNYEACLVQLKSEKLEELCNKNILANAERNYFLGRLSELYPDGKLNPAVQYYEEALQMIQDQSITELTWKLLYALSQYYKKRGMISKAEEHLENFQSIFEFIIDNIKDNYTRQIFLSKPERRSIIEQLDGV